MIPCNPSGLSRRIDMVEEKRRNPSEKTPTKRKIPRIETTTRAGEYPGKNCTPRKSPNAMMMATWMNDFVIPERLIPSMMWVRGMGLASISRISPQFLSKRRLIPPKRLVKRVVIAITPAAMKVR
ncbi:MAG: hypothetical protein BWX50_01472 [Euryarchaeota archaeon ADurb.Bin009]|nr:MAG: hypothetical protein BWX50_01472 [Euryarchaeota archaeon ADurb.Bin009]